MKLPLVVKVCASRSIGYPDFDADVCVNIEVSTMAGTIHTRKFIPDNILSALFNEIWDNVGREVKGKLLECDHAKTTQTHPN